jgi:glycogen synthase
MSCLSLRRVVGLAAMLAMLAGVIPALAQTGGLTGMVKNEKGELLAGYPIIIERQDVKGTYKTKTNK